MNYPNKLKNLYTKLEKTNDYIEQYELLIQISLAYQKMWKLRKALEISQRALRLSQKIIYKQFSKSSKDQLEKLHDIKKQHPRYLKIG